MIPVVADVTPFGYQRQIPVPSLTNGGPEIGGSTGQAGGVDSLYLPLTTSVGGEETEQAILVAFLAKVSIR